MSMVFLGNFCSRSDRQVNSGLIISCQFCGIMTLTSMAPSRIFRSGFLPTGWKVGTEMPLILERCVKHV